MILVTGASGFVGGHLIRGLRDAGHPVRGLVRTSDAAGRLAIEGIEAALGDVGDPASLVRAAEGCEAVIHLVGIIMPGPGFTFQSVHVDGTRNVLEAASRAGTVRHFIYQSALGTREGAPGGYFRTKLEAERLTKQSGLNYTITRPSIIYGRGDGFTTQMAGLIRRAPVIPVIGPGSSLMQPVYIADLVEVFRRIVLDPDYFGQVIEVGGPERLTFNRIMEELKGALGSRKRIVHLPLPLMRPIAGLMEKVMARPPVTRDQLAMLQLDNVCAADSLARFGVSPTPFREGLARFLP